MTAKTSKTKKAKGTKLENKVAERYRHHKVDETAQRMPLSGAMSHFKSDIYKRYDYMWVDECKKHETVKLGEFWRQADAQAGLKTPVLHVSSNYRPVITVIRLDSFEELTGGDMRRFDILDITEKKRWSFWDYAGNCHDLMPRATVVYCTCKGETLVLMTIDCYMVLRKENLK